MLKKNLAHGIDVEKPCSDHYICFSKYENENYIHPPHLHPHYNISTPQCVCDIHVVLFLQERPCRSSLFAHGLDLGFAFRTCKCAAIVTRQKNTMRLLVRRPPQLNRPNVSIDVSRDMQVGSTDQNSFVVHQQV